MKYPTVKQLERMIWGFKLVGVDLHTRGTDRPPYRYQLGAWNEADGPIIDANTNGCPGAPGDGLCVAHTAQGAQSGGQGLGHSAMLIVGYLPDDVLGQEAEGSKVRVRRLWVEPDPVDPVQLVLWDIAANPKGERADLSRADLSGADLSGANLSGANLSGADLYGANLSRAYLSGADLSGADLYGANLSGADLSGAYLSGADLYGADLYGADLSRANLSGAYLSGADLSRADLSGANLSGAYGTESTTLPAGWTVNASGLVVKDPS